MDLAARSGNYSMHDGGPADAGERYPVYWFDNARVRRGDRSIGSMDGLVCVGRIEIAFAMGCLCLSAEDWKGHLGLA